MKKKKKKHYRNSMYSIISHERLWCNSKNLWLQFKKKNPSKSWGTQFIKMKICKLKKKLLIMKQIKFGISTTDFEN